MDNSIPAGNDFRWVVAFTFSFVLWKGRNNLTNELYHHGILGQRWGKRNGPPYPLGAPDHSVSERKAGWKMSLDKTKKERYNSERDKEKTADPEKKKFHLSDKQKRAVKIGAAAAATALAAYGIYKLSRSGKLNDLADKGREFVGKKFRKELKVGSIDPKAAPKFKMLEKPDSVNEVLRKTNPTGNHNNCFNCVVAATARLCGLDVTARGDRSNGKGISFDEVCKVFRLDPDNPKDVVRMANPRIDNVAKQILKRYSDGDVGAIAFAWNEKYCKSRGVDDAGHTLNWIVKDGKLSFIDAQISLENDDILPILSQIDTKRELSIARFANVNDKNTFNITSELFTKFVE